MMLETGVSHTSDMLGNINSTSTSNTTLAVVVHLGRAHESTSSLGIGKDRYYHLRYALVLKLKIVAFFSKKLSTSIELVLLFYGATIAFHERRLDSGIEYLTC